MSRGSSVLLASSVLSGFVFMALGVGNVQGDSRNSERLVNLLTAVTVLTSVQVQGSQLTNRWDSLVSLSFVHTSGFVLGLNVE